VLLLVRHGQYVMSGATDGSRVLTPLGRAQARTRARAHANHRRPPRCDSVHSSSSSS
jgi:broad specificity phosphatase PhoE